MTHPQIFPQVPSSSENRSLTQWSGPLFVVGPWRSGTSLLYALLNKHPRIALMYEADLFVLRPVFWIPGAESRWVARWEFWNDPLRRHGLTVERIQPRTSSLRTAMKSAYQEYMYQKSASIWGEKSPTYYDCLTRLARTFPEARFIIIWRDLGAICRSVVHAAQEPSWFSRRGMTHRALLGYKTLKRECDRLVRRGTCVYQIQYEILVANPADVMKGVCRFLDVPFIADVASLSGADRSAIYEDRHHSLVKGERIASRTERREILPVKLGRKINQYLRLWQEQSGGIWPVSLASKDSECGRPSLAGRVVDQVVYHALRAFDLLVVLGYCFAPLPFLRKYRALKYQRRASSVEIQHREPVDQRQADLQVSPPSALPSATLVAKYQNHVEARHPDSSD